MLWEAYGLILRARGFDPGQASAEWAARQAQKLTTIEARVAFGRLCECGCVPQVLAAILALLHHAPGFKTLWEELLGNRRERQRVVRNLLKTSGMLEDTFGGFIAAENGLMQRPFLELGHLPPSRLISELRFYVQLLHVIEWLAKHSEIRSLEEVSRYLLTSYVKRATEKFRDSDTSALLAEIVGPFDYNDVAQRMWRLRNYKRLDKRCFEMTNFSLAAGVVIARST
jgi:hypothetical protein